MSNTPIGKEAYPLPFTGSQIENILSNVQVLNLTDVKELVRLLEYIKNIDSSDDEDSIGQQLVNALERMVGEDEIQTKLNDSKYPPQSKVVKDAINGHKTMAVLDHPDGSVKGKHIANDAVGSNQIAANTISTNHIQNATITADKLKNYIINEDKLSSDVRAKIINAIDQERLTRYLSSLSKAPKYNLSDLRRNADIGYEIPDGVEPSGYFILKNDTFESYDVNNNLLFNEIKYYKVSGKLDKGKAYLCWYTRYYDEQDELGQIDVLSEMGSDIIDLKTASRGWNGVWHYGDILTHLMGSVPCHDVPYAKGGDFYLNSRTYDMYRADDGINWHYIGNLKGGINEAVWAKLDSPKFSGIPTAPTPSVKNNSGQIATTEFVRDAIDKYASSGSGDDGSISTDLVDNVDTLVQSVSGTDTYIKLYGQATATVTVDDQNKCEDVDFYLPAFVLHVQNKTINVAQEHVPCEINESMASKPYVYYAMEIDSDGTISYSDFTCYDSADKDAITKLDNGRYRIEWLIAYGYYYYEPGPDGTPASNSKLELQSNDYNNIIYFNNNGQDKTLLMALNTQTKSSLVSAINELVSRIATLENRIANLE